MNVLLAQLPPVAGDRAANIATVCNVLTGYRQADLAVFPELFLTGYDPPAAEALAVPARDSALAPISDAAKASETAVVVGFAEKFDGGVANSVACIDTDGSWAGCYRKTHLFGGAERGAFVAGDELLVVELAGQPVAPLICFDIEFPEPARAVANDGAALLITVAANMEPYGPDHGLLVRARALENRRPHVYVNRAGEEFGHRFVGGSSAIGASGEVVAALGREPKVECVQIDPHPAVPGDVDYLAQARSALPVRSAAPASIQRR